MGKKNKNKNSHVLSCSTNEMLKINNLKTEEKLSWFLNSVWVRGTDLLPCWKSKDNCSLPRSCTNSLLLTESLTDRMSRELTHIPCVLRTLTMKSAKENKMILRKSEGSSATQFELSQISKEFSNVFIEKDLRINGYVQLKSMSFKGQLYSLSPPPSRSPTL